MECAGPQQESGAYRLEDVELDVQAYQLHGSESINDSPQPTYADVNGKRDEEGPQARIISLPSKELDGLWESYVISFCCHGVPLISQVLVVLTMNHCVEIDFCLMS